MSSKKSFERAKPEGSQRLRHAFQIGFLLLNLWIGIEFFLWVRYWETLGVSGITKRPPGIEGWLPIASLMNLKVLLFTGELPEIHPAGVILLSAFILMSWLIRRTFCSWLCPVGTVSEYLGILGKKWFRKNWVLPKWADYPLRSLKYILMALFVGVVTMMSVDSIRAFLDGPYGLVADVKMLNFFRDISLVGISVMALLVVASVFVKNFWCRYLCPYGAFLGLFSLASPLRIRRDPVLCIDCAKCAKACPSALPVDQLVTIRTVECTACMSCVASCPAAGALGLSAPGKQFLPAWAIASAITVIFLSFYGYARVTGHWETRLPAQVYQNLVPRANEFSHPR